ncbi:unnamed protein product [Phytophthora lilii]|uniref:Unnamed protein product n=1 Tax=Phytophthora lilii TaxID=2077276 RepID=A0A9W6WMK9_9STRA|nr:unnamed protein product [Phytophthora lilii]
MAGLSNSIPQTSFKMDTTAHGNTASLYNIDTAQFWNNTFKIEVPTAGTTSTASVSLPDGLSSYSDINRSIQTALFNAGAYLINPSGENVFCIQLTENSVYYAAQFDLALLQQHFLRLVALKHDRQLAFIPQEVLVSLRRLVSHA